MLDAFFQNDLIGIAFPAVMKESCDLCLVQIIAVAHGKVHAGVGNAERMLIPHRIQLGFQMLPIR